jgi:exodeoxyribonuclease VII small subunit
LADEPTFKEAIEELEKITASLESGELELEKSLALFERGVELIKYCQDKLDGAQAKVETLLDSLEGEIEVAGEDPWCCIFCPGLPAR